MKKKKNCYNKMQINIHLGYVKRYGTARYYGIHAQLMNKIMLVLF